MYGKMAPAFFSRKSAAAFSVRASGPKPHFFKEFIHFASFQTRWKKKGNMTCRRPLLSCLLVNHRLDLEYFFAVAAFLYSL
jgi:hypothetical protein